ncbi:MAG: sulfotransferase [Halieaceae bacterium]|nr:sulfotransferase [Halieaceae bacterium]
MNVEKVKTMNDLPARPQWVEHLNLMGPFCGGAEYMVSLGVEELLDAARSVTGLEDFGDDDWREDFEVLIHSLNHEARLNTLGRLMVRSEVLKSLQSRLRLIEFWRTHPEVLDSEVNPPIVIAGAARTGTSILFEALAQDEQFHVPYVWRAFDPTPVGNKPEQAVAEKIENARCLSDFWMDVQPEIRAQHDFASVLASECLRFMATHFLTDYWGMVANMPAWQEYRSQKNYVPDSYCWHKRLLQTMQYGEPKDRVWLLKSPAHLIFADVIRQVYPDVRFIHTHRDPIKSIPSGASITATIRRERSDEVDCEAIGKGLAAGFHYAMNNTIDQRIDGRLPEANIADIHLQDLIKDPVAAIKRCYDHFSLNLSEPMKKNIVDYLANKHQGKFGRHTPDIAAFGMSAESLRESFKRYTDYYNIQLEV